MSFIIFKVSKFQKWQIFTDAEYTSMKTTTTKKKKQQKKNKNKQTNKKQQQQKKNKTKKNKKKKTVRFVSSMIESERFYSGYVDVDFSMKLDQQHSVPATLTIESRNRVWGRWTQSHLYNMKYVSLL